MRVLLADDSGAARAVQRRRLERLGVEQVVEAADGREALAAFDAGEFDVVFSDWNMPHVDGLALLREIRKRNEHVPVIMLTGEGERVRVVSAIRAGVSDYLLEPCRPGELGQTLEKWIVPAPGREAAEARP